MGYIFGVKIPNTPIILAATLQWLRTQQAQKRHIVTIIIVGLKVKMWKTDCLLGNWTHYLALHILCWWATILALFLQHFPAPLCNGSVVECLHRYPHVVGVAFPVVWAEPDQWTCDPLARTTETRDCAASAVNLGYICLWYQKILHYLIPKQDGCTIKH